MNIPNKPLALRHKEAQQDIITAFNKAITTYNLPMFDLEQIAHEIYEEIKIMAIKEYNQENEEYQKAMVEYEMANVANDPTTIG